ncbi:DUF1403 family protein [Mesorhizobium newzealandense]|uniref:DUF1403 family protein n=1 Tax=Mesorhizobium newzealandense TaxID=1300302 RepID=A0ABW4UF02_9HYPH
MILRPKPSRPHVVEPAHAEPLALATPTPVPSWLRRAARQPQTLEDAAIMAGAAIGALDAVVRRQERWAGAWRQRLALAAGAVTARQAGRVEDEVPLRDAVLLTRPGDDVGPAGRMFLAWRRLATRPTEELLSEPGIAEVLDDLGLARDDGTVSDLLDDLRQLAGAEGVVAILGGALASAERHGVGRAGAWFADALLAQRLGWGHAVPLLGTEAEPGAKLARARRPGTSLATGVEHQPDQTKGLLFAHARAALRAIDLSAELGRRADRLLAVAPKLRARASDRVVVKLLSGDAIVASEKIAGMSDRGLRRLFDRLVDLGAVRELSGRTTFRIYGL